MKFSQTAVAGAWRIDPSRFTDSRGFFARTFGEEEFATHGLRTRFANSSVAFNHRRGTVRGMHWQEPPHAEVKLVRCTRGAILDVCVDLRRDSPTYLCHVAVELSDENRSTLYVPEGCAHGYQTLSDDAEVLYLISAAYAPQSSGGARYDDPAFAIKWPLPVSEIHARDAGYPDWIR